MRWDGCLSSLMWDEHLGKSNTALSLFSRKKQCLHRLFLINRLSVGCEGDVEVGDLIMTNRLKKRERDVSVVSSEV